LGVNLDLSSFEKMAYDRQAESVFAGVKLTGSKGCVEVGEQVLYECEEREEI
jgi:hypothetical protein